MKKAIHLRKPPDFFELRLDALFHHTEDIEREIPKLRVPLIFTARHPAEGGRNHLNIAARRQLLLRFLHRAAFVDFELRSLGQLRLVRQRAAFAKVGLIISCHHLDDTPPLEQLQRELKTAENFRADIFKIATRTDTRTQLDRLLAFFEKNRGIFPIAAMGIGKLGAESRRLLARRGSALLYASLGAATAQGQPSVRQLCHLARANIK